MDVAAPAAGHPLHQPHAEVVEGYGHLHPGVRRVAVAVTQQHHLVVVREVVVGDGDPRGAHYGVDQAVRAVRQRAVVDPDLPGVEYGDPVAVRPAPPAHVGRARGNVGVAAGLAVVDVDVVDDDVGHELERHAPVAHDVDVGAAAVDGLEAVHDELVLQLDGHVGGEHDPERLLLDHGVPERARDGFRGVAVGGVGDHVDLTPFASHGVTAEPNAAVGELLPVILPVGVATPAVVDGVAGEAIVLQGQHLSS